MLKNTKVLRLIPDAPSKGGSKTAQSTFTTNTDIRVAYNMWVYQGRWQKTPAVETYLGSQEPFGQAIVRSFSVHNFLTYSLTNASEGAISCILTHDKSATTDYINGFFPAALTSFRFNPPVRSITSGSCTPAVYANIKNRVFISWSGTNSFIFDGTATTYNGQRSYDIGVDGPVTAPTYTLAQAEVNLGSVTHGSIYVTTPTILTPGWGTGTVAVKINGVSYDVQSPNGFEDTFTIGGTCSGTAGAITLTINGFLFPANDKWNGLTINISDAGNSETVIIANYVFAGPNTTVTTATALAHNHVAKAYAVTGNLLVLTSAYQGATELLTANIYSYDGPISWSGTGPQYAYAYYDPVTGHISNRSPILQVVEQDQKGVSVSLHGIMTSVATDIERFTEIVIFRTTEGGSTLFPIGVFGLPPTFDTITNTPAVTPKNYSDIHPDSDLIQSVTLQAPQQNNKPPASTHMMYWDQRVWMNPVGDPTAVIFSNDVSQTKFGVAEESFDLTNLLRVPSDDGRVLGMKLVGGTAQITTERYSYAIVGGSDATAYRLVRLGPQTFGVGDYQMAELPGDIGDNSSALAYLSRDARVFIMAPTYGNVPISDPVSDFFAERITTQASYNLSRLHYYSATNVRMIIAACPDAVGMVFNFDQKTWCSATATIDTSGLPVDVQGLATIYGGDRPIDLFIVSAGKVYRWMNVDASMGPTAAFLETAPIDFSNGLKRKSRVQFVRVYTDSPECEVVVTVDESTTPIIIQATQEPDYINSLYAAPSAPIDSTEAVELVAFMVDPISGGTTIASDGFRHQVRVRPRGALQRYSIYAVDIGYQFLDEEGTTS